MTNNSILRLALVALLLVLVQGTSVLAGTTETIQGKVVDQSGNSTTGNTVNSETGYSYVVNAKQISNAQGASGGAETLYSLNAIVGTIPGVNRFRIGSGPGYGGQGQLSVRGGSPDQVGYELDGIPLNRGFDFYNGTSFTTNGVASLEVSTGP